MSKVSLFGIAIIVMLAGIAATASSSHSAVKAAPQIDPLSLMANARNLPSQESTNLRMWPDNGVVR